MSHIDLDMIESIVREAMDHLPPEEQKHEAIEMRCLDVLALVRAVRAAIKARDEILSETLSYAMEHWDWKYGARWTSELAEFDAALEPFRKEGGQ